MGTGNGYAAGEPEVIKKRKELSVFTSREGLVYDQALGTVYYPEKTFPSNV
jgi:hypothetical protein